ncbi:MAG: hypothetical protein ACSHX8_13305 [Opitutaceae bacterium]
MNFKRLIPIPICVVLTIIIVNWLWIFYIPSHAEAYFEAGQDLPVLTELAMRVYDIMDRASLMLVVFLLPVFFCFDYISKRLSLGLYIAAMVFVYGTIPLCLYLPIALGLSGAEIEPEPIPSALELSAVSILYDYKNMTRRDCDYVDVPLSKVISDICAENGFRLTLVEPLPEATFSLKSSNIDWLGILAVAFDEHGYSFLAYVDELVIFPYVPDELDKQVWAAIPLTVSYEETVQRLWPVVSWDGRLYHDEIRNTLIVFERRQRIRRVAAVAGY